MGNVYLLGLLAQLLNFSLLSALEKNYPAIEDFTSLLFWLTKCVSLLAFFPQWSIWNIKDEMLPKSYWKSGFAIKLSNHLTGMLGMTFVSFKFSVPLRDFQIFKWHKSPNGQTTSFSRLFQKWLKKVTLSIFLLKNYLSGNLMRAV